MTSTGLRPAPLHADQAVPATGAGPVWRVRDAKTFTALAASRRRVRRGGVWVAWVPGPSDEPARVAFAVGRKVGGAVTRNRARRRLRAVIAELRPPGGAYLVGLRPDAVDLPFSDLKALVSQAVQALAAPSGRP